MHVSVHTLIKAPIDDVFAQMLDLEKWPENIADITKVDVLTPGPIGVGTRFRETRIMFGHEASEEMTIAEIDAPNHFLLTAESHGVRYRTEHSLTPVEGGTKVQVNFGGQPVSFGAQFMSLFVWLMSRSVENALAKDLQDLKAACEAAHTQS